MSRFLVRPLGLWPAQRRINHTLLSGVAPLARFSRSFSTLPSNPEPSDATKDPPPSRLRVLFRQYGLVFASTYFSVYLVTLGSMFELVSNNYLSANTAIDLMHFVHLDRVFDVKAIDPLAGNFAVAWILTKFTEPVRFIVTASVTPRLARMVGRAPPKPVKRKP